MDVATMPPEPATREWLVAARVRFSAALMLATERRAMSRATRQSLAGTLRTLALDVEWLQEHHPAAGRVV